MSVVIDVLHVVACIGLILVIMFQTTKSEESGGGATGLGWGTIGGKTSSSLNVPVGVERILQPLTFWLAVTFFISAALAAVPADRQRQALTVLGPLYIIIVVFGNRIAAWFRAVFGEE